MRVPRFVGFGLVLLLIADVSGDSLGQITNTEIAKQQVPSWSKDDLNFFLHGSMSTEVVPESVLRAFIKTYPDLFPSWDLTHLGLIPDKEFGWPIGFSRKNVEHLGNMSAIGINCASCHVAQITSTSSNDPIRILGVTSHFNVEGFFGSVLVATFKTSDPTNMKKFLQSYIEADNDAAKRGAPLFAINCNSCHGGPESDKRLFAVSDVGTDPHRAEMFSQKLANGFNKFLAELEAEGYQAPKEVGVRSTGKYFAATLSGVWARSPYLHNGSVRTMHDLLMSPEQRAKTFHRGSRVFDEKELGYTDEGAYVLDTSTSGNSNSGHDYATKLSDAEKRDLMEYLKTL